MHLEEVNDTFHNEGEDYSLTEFTDVPPQINEPSLTENENGSGIINIEWR